MTPETNGHAAAAPGDRLWLCAPAEPYHGLHVVVTAVADFGVHFVAPGHFHPRAVPGWEMRGRALWSELRGEAPAAALEDYPLAGPGLDDAGTMRLEAAPVGAAEARRMGFEGTPCAVCGGMRVVRNGTCLLCTECHSTNGCG